MQVALHVPVFQGDGSPELLGPWRSGGGCGSGAGLPAERSCGGRKDPRGLASLETTVMPSLSGITLQIYTSPDCPFVWVIYQVIPAARKVQLSVLF